MNNTKIIELLNNLANLLEINGENSFKSGAYRTAADIIETQNLDVAQLISENKLGEINGFGKALVEKLTDLIQNGKMEYYEKVINEVPESLLKLTRIEGLGTKKIGRLYRELGIKNIDELKRACEKNQISELKGFGKKTEQNILEQINE
jgi:DNA polymerase (family 10)